MEVCAALRKVRRRHRVVRGCRSWGREPCAEGKDHPGPATGGSVPGGLFCLSLSTKQLWERSFQAALSVGATWIPSTC